MVFSCHHHVLSCYQLLAPDAGFFVASRHRHEPFRREVHQHRFQLCWSRPSTKSWLAELGWRDVPQAICAIQNELQSMKHGEWRETEQRSVNGIYTFESSCWDQMYSDLMLQVPSAPTPSASGICSAQTRTCHKIRASAALCSLFWGKEFIGIRCWRPKVMSTDVISMIDLMT